MANGKDAVSDFSNFAYEEQKRVAALNESQTNAKPAEWWADADLQLKRKSMHDFFDKFSDSPVGNNEIIAVKRCADTIAAFDRCYKFRRQGRLDNVPRAESSLEMDSLYWDSIPDVMEKLATL